MHATDPIKPVSNWQQLVLLILILVAARLLFIALMPATYSTDLHSWLRVMDNLGHGGNPYRDLDVLNWPPFWMQFIFVIQQVGKLTGWSAIHLIQATLITGEVLVLISVYLMGKRCFPEQKRFYPLLVGLALNPISIFLSCQHCNYDVFVGLFVLLGTWMLTEWTAHNNREAWLAACFFIGMGILAKTVPVLLTPLLLVGIRRLPWSTRIFGAILLTVPFAIGMSVLFSLEPHGVMRNVVGYRSLAGWYGITGLMWRAGWIDGMGIYQRISPVLFLGLMICMVAWSIRRDTASAKAILLVALLTMLFIPTFGPGYSPPYLLWFLPLLCLLFISSKSQHVLLSIGLGILILTYITEYALFNSHGAFLQQWYPSEHLSQISEEAGSRSGQTLIRLPMFGFYIWLFVSLIRQLRAEGNPKALPASVS